MDEDNMFEMEPMEYQFNARLGPCEVCGANEAIYTCPKCEVKTCCLSCVKIHKRELECNGVRDRTKFVRLKKFTNLDLLSDYRLLEEVTRSVDSVKKSKTTYKVDNKDDLPIHLHRLRSAAMRRETILKFMPRNFTRRKENTTYLDWKSQIITWKIEWVFPLADNLKIVDEKCSETESIGSLLNKYFEPKNLDDLVVQRLQFYISAGLPNVRVLLKAEEKRGKKYYELDMSVNLRKAFKYKIIIENPTIHVVLKEHHISYDIIDTDEEHTQIKKEIESRESIMHRLENIRIGREKRKLKKNLLFVTDFSESEPSSEDDSSTNIKVPKRTN